ncbi:hypothetical protein GCM10009760_14520 [Kitasatospora kazusensis]|uniref:Uncharacterized protein n=1 Tax=Kitasatospora kazusensis TaxID=407974 RepID=A0ABN2Z290_9ACTN
MTVSYLNDTDPGAVDPADTQAGDTRPGPREELGRYAELGGFTLTADSNPWYAAADVIETPEDARAASTVLAELRSRDISATRDAVLGLTPEGGLGEPDTVVGLSLVVGVLQRVYATAGKLRAEAYDADLDELTAATADGRWRKEQGVKLSWARRRSLRAQAKKLVVGKRGRRSDLHEALAAAAAERSDWSALAASGAARPTVPADAEALTEASQAVDALGQAVRALGRLLPGLDPESTPLADLADLIDRLAADERTLYLLPARHSLRAALSDLGPDELLAELTERQADREAAVAAYDLRAGTEDAAADVAVEAVGDVDLDVDADSDADSDAASDVEGDAEEAARQALAAGPRSEAVPAAEELAPVEIPAQAQAKPAAVEVEVEVEVAAEVEPEAEVVAEPEPEPEAVVEPELVAEVEPEAVVESEVVAEVEPEPVVEVEPVVIKAEADVAEVEPEAVVEPELVAEVEPEAVVEPEPVVEVEPVVIEAEAEVVAEVEPEPVAEVEVEVEPEPVAEVAPAVTEVEKARPVRRPKKPSLTPGRPVTAYTAAELTALVRWIDSDGVDRTEDELLRAAMKELGFARLGPRIKEALGAAVSEARS